MLVSIDRERDRVMVLDKTLPTGGMVLRDGAWSDGAFTADDLKDNFERVTDSKEAAVWRHKAAAALESIPELAKGCGR